MTGECEVTNHERYVRLNVHGQFSRELAIRMIDLSIAKCQEYDQNCVLMDVRKMPGAITIMDRLLVGLHATRVRRFGIRTALIARTDQMLPDKFLENFLVNRGVQMRIFADPVDGEKWLAR